MKGFKRLFKYIKFKNYPDHQRLRKQRNLIFKKQINLRITNNESSSKRK